MRTPKEKVLGKTILPSLERALERLDEVIHIQDRFSQVTKRRNGKRPQRIFRKIQINENTLIRKPVGQLNLENRCIRLNNQSKDYFFKLIMISARSTESLQQQELAHSNRRVYRT